MEIELPDYPAKGRTPMHRIFDVLHGSSSWTNKMRMRGRDKKDLGK